MTAQQTAAKERTRKFLAGIKPTVDPVETIRADERKRIRRALLAVGVIREGVWVYRESVIAAIKKATRAPAKGRR